MTKTKPFDAEWISLALRFVSKQADWDSLGYENPNPDDEPDKDPNLPSYYKPGDAKLMAAAPVMAEALRAVRDKSPDADALVAEALGLVGDP